MPLTLGVEEEYLLVDAATGELAPRGPGVLARAEPVLGEEVAAELSDCQVEINAPACTSLDDVYRHLLRLRASVRMAADPLGLRPCALAAHPWSSWYDQPLNTRKNRYAQLVETYQQIARQQVICGCHVHVGVEDPDNRVRVMNRIRPWLPSLLALSANSPFWEGHDTGYASYRTVVWGRWPTARMPPALADFAAYERLVGQLEAVEAIATPRSLYWYARPSSHVPTVEVRVADVCLNAADAVVIAGLARGLVATCLAGGDQVAVSASVPDPLLDTALWRAARYGTGETLLDPLTVEVRPATEVFEQLVAFVSDALGDDRPLVVDGIERILSDGSGATRQRRFAEGPGSRASRLALMLGAG